MKSSLGAPPLCLSHAENLHVRSIRGPMTVGILPSMKFENERTRAARDLVAQILAFNPGSIFDLGCGPGNGTELLAAAFLARRSRRP